MEPPDACCGRCADNSRQISILIKEITELKKNFQPTEKVKLYSSNTQKDSTPSVEKSYKHPDLSCITKELMQTLFNDQKEKLPYKLFRYIYFAAESPANGTIKAPTKSSTSPRNLTICDYGEWHKSPAADVLIEVNSIICGIINTYLAKSDIYDKMDLADKKLIGDMVCRRFDKKISQEVIRNYISALL